ncbi:RNA-directed DNA polymerase, eukaryota, reverse transcriptase zinc-binding domain protein [Tanacetum coccineum]
MLKDRTIMDQFICKKIQPSVQEIKNWSKDMITYFKDKWKDDEERVEEDIVEEVNELERNITANEIDRRGSITRQSIPFHIKDIKGKKKLYCTFVYASNNKEERKTLWNEIYMHKRVSGNSPWALLGDMNVTLNIEEHSSGGSFVTDEMQEFKDCVNLVEVEDIGSTGFYFTWTKSLKNPDNSVLKKLDRVMVSEAFIKEFARSHAIFQPFLIYDHSPAILIIPTCGTKRAKSFRFANYIADKPDFITELSKGWKIEIQGYKLYCLVKKMKYMKPILNKLNWKNGDLTVRVEKLRNMLKEAQTLVERNPHNKSIKTNSIKILEDYNDAVKDEEKLLAQKARIDWLNDGDKNSAFFHKIIKGRRSRNRVHTICDENGMKFEDEDVLKQFIRHFQQFLGQTSVVYELQVSNDLFSNTLSHDEAAEMVKEVSNKEIKDALFDIGDNKAPGPDGYSFVFFKKA